MDYIIFTIFAILSILAIVNASDSSYSASGSAVHNQIIKLDSTSKRSYTHYLANENNSKNYTFSIQMSEEFPGIFTDISQLNFRGLLPISKFGSATKICDVYQMKFTYPNGGSRLLCNETRQVQVSYLDSDPGIIEDYSGRSGLIVVDVSIISNYWNRYSGDEYNKLIEGPLVGPTGRQIPRFSIGSISFTAYKDCSDSTLEDKSKLVLKSCSASDKSKCIASDLFCDGDINCGVSILDVFITGEVDQQGFDESDKQCSNNRIWAQVPELGPGFSSEYLFILLGLIVFVIGILIRVCCHNKVTATTNGQLQQALLREP